MKTPETFEEHIQNHIEAAKNHCEGKKVLGFAYVIVIDRGDGASQHGINFQIVVQTDARTSGCQQLVLSGLSTLTHSVNQKLIRNANEETAIRDEVEDVIRNLLQTNPEEITSTLSNTDCHDPDCAIHGLNPNRRPPQDEPAH